MINVVIINWIPFRSFCIGCHSGEYCHLTALLKIDVIRNSAKYQDISFAIYIFIGWKINVQLIDLRNFMASCGLFPWVVISRQIRDVLRVWSWFECSICIWELFMGAMCSEKRCQYTWKEPSLGSKTKQTSQRDGGNFRSGQINTGVHPYEEEMHWWG